MNSRERFFTTLKHQEPDRIPYIALLYDGLVAGLTAELPPETDYRDYYKEDIRLVKVDYPEYSTINLKERFFPLPTDKALEEARAKSEQFKERGLVTCNRYVPGIFEHLKEFTNDEFALTHMLLEPEDCEKLISAITDWLCRLYEKFAKVGFDICWNGDDIGTQRSTIMSIESYREFYKENHRKLLTTIKSANADTQVAFHCCGHIHTILPEWVDLGIDIIHSVQPEANDLAMIKEKYGQKITFWGVMGLQSELFYLSLPEMKEQLKKYFRIMGPGGGFIAATSNYATDEVGLDKIKLLYETLQEFGSYPNPGC